MWTNKKVENVLLIGGIVRSERIKLLEEKCVGDRYDAVGLEV